MEKYTVILESFRQSKKNYFFGVTQKLITAYT